MGVPALRAALISLAGQPRDAQGEPLYIAGKTLARRQLEFALATGCTRIVGLGDGTSPEAIALGHTAERSGARFIAIRDSHGLFGAVRAEDELLVLAPGLLPDCGPVVDALKQPAVVVIPAADAARAGFERIDLERAWGGVLLAPGELAARMTELAPDSEPSAALLRIALQARIRQVPLAPEALKNGAWTIVRGSDAPAVERTWWARHRPSTAKWSASERAAQTLVAAFAPHRANDRAALALAGGAGALLIAAAALAWSGWSALGFAVVAAGVILAACARALAHVMASPFAEDRGIVHRSIPAVIDLALVACCAGAILDSWPDRLFAPVVMIAMLHTVRWSAAVPAATLLRDRAVLGLLLGVAAGLGLVKAAIMVVAMALIVLHVAEIGPERG